MVSTSYADSWRRGGGEGGLRIETTCHVAFAVRGKIRRLKAVFIVFVVLIPTFNICFS